jgi:hypothetical protein
MLTVPKSMEAFGVTDYNVIDIDMLHDNDSELAKHDLKNYFGITHKGKKVSLIINYKQLINMNFINFQMNSNSFNSRQQLN